jgi:hypothetical protein
MPVGDDEEGRYLGEVKIRTVINAFTFDGATKDPMQKAVRDALIGFMAATAQAAGRGHQGRSASRY